MHWRSFAEYGNRDTRLTLVLGGPPIPFVGVGTRSIINRGYLYPELPKPSQPPDQDGVHELQASLHRDGRSTPFDSNSVDP